MEQQKETEEQVLDLVLVSYDNKHTVELFVLPVESCLWSGYTDELS